MNESWHFTDKHFLFPPTTSITGFACIKEKDDGRSTAEPALGQGPEVPVGQELTLSFWIQGILKDGPWPWEVTLPR